MTELVQIAAPLEPSQALPMLSALRAHGFQASASNLEHARVFPSLRLALGGFPIYVPLPQSVEARRFLNEFDNLPTEEISEYGCPRCGGASHRKPWRIASWILCLACTIGIEMRGRKRECRQCAHSWHADTAMPLTDEEMGYTTYSGLEEFQIFLAAIRSLGQPTDDNTMDKLDEH